MYDYLRNSNLKTFDSKMGQKFHPALYCHSLVLHLDKSGQGWMYHAGCYQNMGEIV